LFCSFFGVLTRVQNETTQSQLAKDLLACSNLQPKERHRVFSEILRQQQIKSKLEACFPEIMQPMPLY
jgi:hypothetical protein